MATISSLGIGSGLDLSGIVEGLVAAERAPVEAKLGAQQESATTRLSAFGALSSSLSLFQGSYSNLKFSSTFDSKNVSIGDQTLFTATATSAADAGIFSIEVAALARAQSLASAEATAFEDIQGSVGSGTLTVKFGETTTGPYNFTQDTSKPTHTIEVSEENGNTTLSGLRDYINDNDYEFTASIINDGNGFRMVFTAESTGVQNSLEISVTDDDGGNIDNSGLSQFAFNASAQTSLQQTVAGQDASLIVNGLTITRENNTVSGAIDGVTLNLLKADPGSPTNVSIVKDDAGVKSGVQQFVDGYNGLISAVNSLTNYDAETQQAGVLLGDFTIRNITSQLRNMVFSPVDGLNDNIQTLADIGITTQLDGSLQLDQTRLDDALEEYPDQVEALFVQTARITDPDISFVSSGSGTQPGDYALNITTLASRGGYTGAVVNSLIIDSNNDGFTLKVDDVSSGEINLVQDTYADGASLATHIQAQINADPTFINSGVSVSVTYDTDTDQFEILSTSYGADSSVEVVGIDPNSANDLGLSIASGVSGVDVAGTIGGFVAQGNGQILSSIAGSSNGLSVNINSGATGFRGNVAFADGMLGELDRLLDSFLSTGGYIDTRESGLNDELEEITDSVIEFGEKLTRLEDSLIRRFSALDQLISQMNSTSSFLTQQLDNLIKPNSIGRNR
jgi:flagellar hook-associated protein 2